MLMKDFITGTKVRTNDGMIDTIDITANSACIVIYNKKNWEGRISNVYGRDKLKLYNPVGKQLLFAFMEED